MTPDELLPAQSLAALERLRLVVNRLPGGRGGEAGRGRPGGFGMDFYEYVPFGPGDDLRRVDWRRYQRTGDLLLRTDLDRSGHPVLVVVDRSGSMRLGRPSKLSFAVRTAAAVAFAALQAGHPVGAVAFAGSEGAVVPARPGLHWLDTILRFLGDLRPSGPTALSAGLLGALSGARSSGRIVVVSDFLDPAGPALALDLLTGPRRAADVVEIVAPGEETLPLGDSIDAVDPETGRRRTFTVTSEVADAFRGRLAALRAEVEQGCRARGLVHLRCRSDGDPVAAVAALCAARTGE